MGHPACPARKRGASRSGAHAAAQAAAEPASAVPGCAGVTRGSSNADFVRKFARALRDCRARARPSCPAASLVPPAW